LTNGYHFLFEACTINLKLKLPNFLSLVFVNAKQIWGFVDLPTR